VWQAPRFPRCRRGSPQTRPAGLVLPLLPLELTVGAGGGCWVAGFEQMAAAENATPRGQMNGGAIISLQANERCAQDGQGPAAPAPPPGGTHTVAQLPLQPGRRPAGSLLGALGRVPLPPTRPHPLALGPAGPC
jgi:hypothetical protein